MNKGKQIFMLVGMLVVGLFVGSALVALAADWTAPLHQPPTCPAGEVGCDAPIHVGSIQVKGGGLILNNNFPASPSGVSDPRIMALAALGKTYIGFIPTAANNDFLPASTQLEVKNGLTKLTGGLVIPNRDLSPSDPNPPAADKILASKDATGEAVWKTAAELGITGGGAGAKYTFCATYFHENYQPGVNGHGFWNTYSFTDADCGGKAPRVEDNCIGTVNSASGDQGGAAAFVAFNPGEVAPVDATYNWPSGRSFEKGGITVLLGGAPGPANIYGRVLYMCGMSHI